MDEEIEIIKNDANDQLDNKIDLLLDNTESGFDKLIETLEILTKVKRLDNVLDNLKEKQMDINKKIMTNSKIISELEQRNTEVDYTLELNKNREKYLCNRKIRNSMNSFSQDIEVFLCSSGLEQCDIQYITSVYRSIVMELICTDLSNNKEVCNALETLEGVLR